MTLLVKNYGTMWQNLLEENWLLAINVIGTLVAIIGLAIFKYRHTDNVQIPTCPRAAFKATDPEVIIVGGGFTGASLAAVLAADGRKVVVIERDMSPPDTFRGEGLTPGGAVAMKELGLEHVMETITHTRLNGYIYYDESLETKICLPFLTTNGYLVRHGDFVNALRINAMEEKSVTFINASGKELIKEEGRVVGVEYREKGSEDLKKVRAPLTVICDGYYSSLRKEFSSLPKQVSTKAILGLELKDINPPKGPGWTQVFMGNPLGVYFAYSIGEDAYRYALEVVGEPPKDHVSFLRDTVAPTMPEHMRKPVLEALEKGTRPKCIPVKIFKGDLTHVPPGVILIGDVLNSRDPCGANGMTVSFRDIMYWRDALRGADLCNDLDIFKLRLRFKEERYTWAWANNTLAHVMSTFLLNTDVGTCRMRQQFVRALKQTESASEEEIRGLMDILFNVNTDPATVKAVLETTRNDTIRHAFKSRPWTGVFSAIYEAVFIYYKFNEICGPGLKAYSNYDSN